MVLFWPLNELIVTVEMFLINVEMPSLEQVGLRFLNFGESVSAIESIAKIS